MLVILMVAQAVPVAERPDRTVCLSSRIRQIWDRNRAEMAQALARFDARRLSTRDTPWMVTHGLLGHAGDFAIDSTTGDVGAVWWLVDGAAADADDPSSAIVEWAEGAPHYVRMNSMMQPPFGEAHFGDTAMCLWMAGVGRDDQRLRSSDGRLVAVGELARGLMAECHEYADVSWALPVLLAWAPTGTWKNRFGETVTFDGLVGRHLANERTSLSCFGCHWRLGLVLAVKHAGGRVSGEAMNRARDRVDQLLRECRATQTADGTFGWQHDSVPAGGEIASDAAAWSPRALDISYQAHTLEWVCEAVSDADLGTESWVHLGVERLLVMLQEDGSIRYDVEAHAAHALRVYLARMNRVDGVHTDRAQERHERTSVDTTSDSVGRGGALDRDLRAVARIDHPVAGMVQ